MTVIKTGLERKKPNGDQVAALRLYCIVIGRWRYQFQRPWSASPGITGVTDGPLAGVPFDIGSLKRNWRSRIEAIRSSGELPIIDIESSFDARAQPGSVRQTHG